jgi:hypothetical protein
MADRVIEACNDRRSTGKTVGDGAAMSCPA